MEGGEGKQLEFEKMLDTVTHGGPEAEEVIKQAEEQKLIDACEDAGVEPPSPKEIERIIENGKKHEEPELDYEREWERIKEEREARLWPDGIQNRGV